MQVAEKLDWKGLNASLPKVMFNNKKQPLCMNNLSLEIKKKLIKSCICSVAVGGSQRWTVGENGERVVNGFET
jgi:hypothetical protein